MKSRASDMLETCFTAHLYLTPFNKLFSQAGERLKGVGLCMGEAQISSPALHGFPGSPVVTITINLTNMNAPFSSCSVIAFRAPTYGVKYLGITGIQQGHICTSTYFLLIVGETVGSHLKYYDEVYCS